MRVRWRGALGSSLWRFTPRAQIPRDVPRGAFPCQYRARHVAKAPICMMTHMPLPSRPVWPQWVVLLFHSAASLLSEIGVRCLVDLVFVNASRLCIGTRTRYTTFSGEFPNLYDAEYVHDNYDQTYEKLLHGIDTPRPLSPSNLTSYSRPQNLLEVQSTSKLLFKSTR